MRIRPLRSATDTPLAPVEAPPADMRAMVVEAAGDADALRAASVPVPSPVLSQVLVRVVAAGDHRAQESHRIGAQGSGRLVRPRARL